MKKSVLKQMACLATLLSPMAVFATDAPAADAAAPAAAPAAPAAKEKLFVLAGNLAFVSDYLFRGQTQTFGRPAVQGGFEARQYDDHGFLAGIWGSNVSSAEFINSDGMEADLYFGYAHKFNDDWSAKILAYWYLYPGAKVTTADGATSDDNYNAMEIIPSLTWKWFTLTGAYAVTDKSGINDNFAPIWGLDKNGNTKGSWYGEIAGRFPIFDTGVSLNLVYGYQRVRHYNKLNFSNYGASLDWTTPEEWHAVTLKAGFSTTNNNTTYYTVTNKAGDKKDIGRTIGYVSISKSF